MKSIYRTMVFPSFEVLCVNGRYSSRRFNSDASFVRTFQRNSIEDALKRYHIRFKSYYQCVVYIDENRKQHWLRKSDCTEGFTIQRGGPTWDDPREFNWLR